MKTEILAALGEAELGRAAQVNAALGANDRIKYCLALLQMAAAQADHPEQTSSTLRAERLACGVDDASLDDLVPAARREGDSYRMPGCAKLLRRVAQELRAMAAPVTEDSFAGRLEAVLPGLEMADEDLIEASRLQAITRAGTAREDSLHQLVMDLHKRLNTMQAELAEERIDGAAVYRIEARDRPLIAAFMAGVNRTAPLKFSHPGLDTTATRAGRTLVIQNDIGTTGAHVIVIHVDGLSARVTYTDVHAERAQFFRDLLGKYEVEWTSGSAGRLGEESFTMQTGSYRAKNRAELEEYLKFLGSRIVFLIDWNRARKQLRGFLRAEDRAAVLRWAADAEVGHRGFLELGGASAINRAIEKIPGSAMHFGDRLCDVLGNEATVAFVEFVFRAATQGLRQHQSSGLIHDRISAELQAHFASEGQRLLQLAGEHAGLIFELASQVREGLREVGGPGAAAIFQSVAKRARGFEHDADELVSAAREAVRKRPQYAPLFKVTETADDAADELEEVAFLLGLLRATEPGGETLDALAALSALLMEAAGEWVKALGHAVHIRSSGRQDDADDFLRAIDRLLALEHEADDAERALTYAAVQKAKDFRQLHLYSEIGGSLEAASDSLKGAALVARDHLFASMLGA
ncbi:MAG TPA: hypothetical protein VEF06_11810 [Bryobacteraceae bacterium]|nr:hypothetical protein [Bryobacteraceae bacterium]